MLNDNDKSHAPGVCTFKTAVIDRLKYDSACVPRLQFMFQFFAVVELWLIQH